MEVDTVVIATGAPPKPAQARIDTLHMLAKLVELIINPIMESGFYGHFIIISNPVYMIAYDVYKLIDLDRSRIIRTGTSVDFERLKNFNE
ncbi:lactate/malate family dehydrogenase [Clostridium sp. NSJ-145]|uniref:lactate/malate family dehydrogenase n=1 Tax=Clostridium sp. NSJ-145 TaxID=2897777 RepID=UPI002ED7D067